MENMTSFCSKLKKVLFSGMPVVFYLFLARFAMADLRNPLSSPSFAALVRNIARIVAQIGVPIAVVAIIYAGFLFVTARGNEKKLEDAKRTFFWAVIGTVILLGSWGLATAIEQFMRGL